MANIYADIRFLERVCKELEAQTGVKGNKAREYLDDLKRKVRRADRNYHFHPEEAVVFQNNFDTAFFKYPLPEDLKTREEAEEYFEEYERIKCIPSPYDCTGQRFTGFHHIFRKPDGRFWVYHRIDMDV